MRTKFGFVRGAAAIAVVVAIGALFTGVALAQQYPPAAPSVGTASRARRR